MGDHERLLLADDDDYFRQELKLIIEREGHSVVAQASGVSEITALVDNIGLDFSVAVLDHNMPAKGEGRKAASYIREHRKNAKIISFSSDTQDYADVNLCKLDGSEPLLKALKQL